MGPTESVFIGGLYRLRLLASGGSWRSINAEEGADSTVILRDPAFTQRRGAGADHTTAKAADWRRRTLARFAASLMRHVSLASLRSDPATPVALDRARVASIGTWPRATGSNQCGLRRRRGLGLVTGSLSRFCKSPRRSSHQ
jgi:hypothetical protein